MNTTESPVVGVGTVVFRGEEVLMVRRANDPGAGRWSIPGGRLELGETTEQGARREVQEETGIVCEILGLIGVYDAVIRGDEGEITDHFTLVNHGAKWLSGEPMAGDDALEAVFIKIEDALALDLWDEVRDVIEKGRSQISNSG